MGGKELGVGRGRRLGVRSGKDAADHGEQVGPSGDQGRAILRSDAPYGNQRQAERRAGLAQQIWLCSHRTGFGDGGEKAAEGDIVRACLLSGEP